MYVFLSWSLSGTNVGIKFSSQDRKPRGLPHDTASSELLDALQPTVHTKHLPGIEEKIGIICFTRCGQSLDLYIRIPVAPWSHPYRVSFHTFLPIPLQNIPSPSAESVKGPTSYSEPTNMHAVELPWYHIPSREQRLSQPMRKQKRILT